MATEPTDHKPKLSNGLIAGACVVFVTAMIGMAYAAVPLYQLFCQVTGYGGTTQVASQGASGVIDRVITIRFDANVSNDLNWSFAPVQRQIELRVGETALAFYRAESSASRATTGTAAFNVTPLAAGAYFNKIECFCFTEQTLEPGQLVDMPVNFFVDPAIDDDPDLASVTSITLSYTFFEIDGDVEASQDSVSVQTETESNMN
jgi:cytochrome c oxidase assembly protein subunit 11